MTWKVFVASSIPSNMSFMTAPSASLIIIRINVPFEDICFSLRIPSRRVLQTHWLLSLILVSEWLTRRRPSFVASQSQGYLDSRPHPRRGVFQQSE